MPLLHAKYYEVPVSCWPKDHQFRLALLSDLHNNIYPGLLSLLEREAPKAVLIAGDMINRPTDRTPPRFTRGYGLVGKMADRFPVYYALGNHESTWKQDPRYESSFQAYQRALEKKGVVFLDNECVSLGDEEHPLYVSGLTLGKEQFTHHIGQRRAPSVRRLKELLPGPYPFQILLAHHPDYFETYAGWGADLVLSGHYHGGQFRLPGLGGLIGPGFQLLPPFTRGLYEKGACRMIVSAGLGTHTIPFRVGNPRELVLVDLKGK